MDLKNSKACRNEPTLLRVMHRWRTELSLPNVHAGIDMSCECIYSQENQVSLKLCCLGPRPRFSLPRKTRHFNECRALSSFFSAKFKQSGSPRKFILTTLCRLHNLQYGVHTMLLSRLGPTTICTEKLISGPGIRALRSTYRRRNERTDRVKKLGVWGPGAL